MLVRIPDEFTVSGYPFTGIDRITISSLAIVEFSQGDEDLGDEDLGDEDRVQTIYTTPKSTSIDSRPNSPTVSPEAVLSIEAGSAYIDCHELAIALDLYYMGQLDWVEPENICRPLRELVPGSPLISQLCQDDMAKALSLIDNRHCLSLRAWHSQNTEERASVSSDGYLSAIAALASCIFEML